MKFGSIPLDYAEGAILAHSVRLESGAFKKGRRLSATDIVILGEAGIQNVSVAKLSDDDVPEDVAAQKIAIAVCGAHTVAQEAFTGRANLHAQAPGLVLIDAVRVRAINHLHESLTLATLPSHGRVAARAMVATVKIIPFALPRDVLDTALTIIGEMPLVAVVPFQKMRVGLIITRLSQTKESLIAKSESAIRDRVEGMGSALADVRICDHAQMAVAAQIKTMSTDVILVLGAAAIVDRGDVIPAGLVTAGGGVVHMGMPVDPGNLLMLGKLGQVPVIGVPSCARSSKTNGFDWVLARVLAGMNVTSADIMDMGVGGLLAEIPSRPSPRDPKPSQNSAPRVVALVLAAGSSTRMGSNKLLADIHGQPMIARTVQQIAGSSVEKIMVVTGHQSAEVERALQAHHVELVHNPDFAVGLSASLKVGVAAVQNSCDAILVCLGDMPLVDARDINRMIAAFNADENRNIVVPVHGSKFGNPVLWGAAHFAALMQCEGDRGARGLLENLRDALVEISVENAGVALDADTPEALALIKSIALPGS